MLTDQIGSTGITNDVETYGGGRIVIIADQINM